MINTPDDFELLQQLLEIYDQSFIGEYLNETSTGQWCRETVNRWQRGKASPRLSHKEYQALLKLLPPRPAHYDKPEFDFIDLFAGIGGIRRGFEEVGGRCVFTSEWNEPAVRTYKANNYSDPAVHVFNTDIRKVTLSDQEDVTEKQIAANINALVPDHDVLLAGFPCQPFSIAGVSKKNARF